MMKPILFNTEMVRAIQDGTKTVTRRVVKPRKHGARLEMVGETICETIPKKPPFNWGYIPCEPPYSPGDILYVRETFQVDYLSNIPGTGRIHYKADDTYADFSFSPERYDMMRRAQLKPGWRPNENMPREAARIFLRATAVRVERLRDITGADAKREGFANRGAFIREFLAMYPDCTMETWLWVIELERISREEAMRNA